MGFLDALAGIAAGWGGPEPYGRPGSHLLLTGEQWGLYDQQAAMAERQEQRYGPPGGFPGAAGSLRGVRGRVLL